MTEYNSLNSFKEIKRIADSNGSKISYIFNKLFEEYLYGIPKEEKFSERLLKDLLEECREINPTLIPYAEITNVIFTSEDYNNYLTNGSETSFTEKLKSEFEKYVVGRFGIDNGRKSPRSNEELFEITSEKYETRLSIDETYQNAILVMYKIIQHSELAISQKRSLYENLKEEILSLNNTVYDATNKYENMMSNFISILGIFAAIMMVSFGAIQGFTAIYSNENGYSLTKILIISSFGLFALISVLYLLLYSISKLAEKDIGLNEYGSNFFNRYPIYSHSLLITFLIFLLSLTHMFKYNSPDYFPDHLSENLWGYTTLFIVCLFLMYILHYLISKNNGYWFIYRQIESYLRKLKRFIGRQAIVNIVMAFMILIPIIIVVLAFIVLG